MIKETNDVKLINSFLKHFDTAIEEIGVYSKYLVYYIDNEAVGFLSYDLIYDRIEIEYIFVDPNNRRNNIASFLMDYVFNEAKKNECSNITLEVRESNTGAISFYNINGFKEVAKRSNYYNNENAILMIREM